MTSERGGWRSYSGFLPGCQNNIVNCANMTNQEVDQTTEIISVRVCGLFISSN